MTATAVESFKCWRPLLRDLAKGIHPERWAMAGVRPEAAKRLIADPRSRLVLSRRLDWVTGKPDDSPGTWPDWSAWPAADAAARGAGDDLWKCGLRLGAALFRNDVARLVMGKDVASFKAGAGEDCYFFALRRAGLLRELESVPLAAAKAETLVESIRRAACLGLGCWLAELPPGLPERVILKLPTAVDAAPPEVATWGADSRGKWVAALKSVFAATLT